MRLVKWLLLGFVVCMTGCAVVPLDHSHTVVVDEGTVVEEQMVLE